MKKVMFKNIIFSPKNHNNIQNAKENLQIPYLKLELYSAMFYILSPILYTVVHTKNKRKCYKINKCEYIKKILRLQFY